MEHFYQKIQGWFDYQNLYTKMVNELLDGSHIVEVGAWKGRSSAYLGVEIINSGKNIKLDVVDIWTGEEDDPDAFTADAEFMQYNKNIFELFKKNVAPALHVINPIQMPSAKASKLYQDNSLDFVFIDANHDYEPVKLDIISWLPKIKKTGTIAGHDFNPAAYPGVVKAVHEIFANKKVELDGACWIVKL